MKPSVVRLKVRDMERARDFYRETVGLVPVGEEDGVVAMGVDSAALVELVPSPDAPARPPRTTGLFHLAILLPSRAALADALRRVASSDWSLTGASDHLVSEALYLSDPEGNGIELYRDRPREEWRRSGGEIQMATLPLDLERLAAEASGDAAPSPETTIGHVHLNVADLERAERFYCDGLGFEVTTRGYPGALFVSAEGYHHHIGLNTWNGEGAPAPPAGALGLDRFELVVDDQAELAGAERRLGEAGVEATRTADGLLSSDPFGNRVLIRAR